MTATITRAVEIGRRLREDVLRPMKDTFVGKDDVIDVLGVCLAAREHLFLLGPPGTAKSALVHELSRRLEGKSFAYLLTRFTEPSELFGPLDIRRLREGELTTNTSGMLPEASLVFLDELLNANSAILNCLLEALNERVFRRGREAVSLPLLSVVGASNHLPEDEALGALYDRFLVRVVCDRVPDDRLGDVLRAGWSLEAEDRDAGRPVPVDDVRELHRALPEVSLDAVHDGFVRLVQQARGAGVALSDRRAVKVQRLVAASALLCERAEARTSDLWVFRHLWDTVEQHEILSGLVDDAIGDNAGEESAHPQSRRRGAPDPESLARELEALEARLDERGDDETEIARLRDHVGVLAGRCDWVQDETKREFLREKVDALWARVRIEN